VWEVRLRPGERGPFHAHTRRYFWTVVDGGTGLQRSADGTYRVRRSILQCVRRCQFWFESAVVTR
jgi:quercetin dioxygenase-like cupin family protein